MSTLALVPLSEYLGHTTDPDCEYVDGHLVARNVGEIGHSDAQGRTYAFVSVNCRNFWAGLEVRVQVRAERYRVPDVVIVRGGRPRDASSLLRRMWPSKCFHLKTAPATCKTRLMTICSSAFRLFG